MKQDIVPKNKKSSIDALNEQLYYKNKEFDNRTRRTIHDKSPDLEHDFNDGEYEKALKGRPKRRLPQSLFKKIFFAVSVFFLVALAAAAFSLLGEKKTVSSDLISMEILGQTLVDGGEPLKLQVRIQNFNEQTLQLPDLVLSYKKDSYIDGNEVFLRRSLDDIAQNNRASEEFNVTLFGQEGDIRNINASLEYRIEGSSSIFVKDLAHEIVIRSTPTRFALEAPDTLTKNQEVSFDLIVASNSTSQVSNGLVKVDYPAGFEFISSSIEPTYGTNIWEMGTVTQDEDIITVTGRLSALEGQGQSFRAFFGKQNILNKRQHETIFNTVVHTVEVEKPFINTQLVINNKDNPIVPVKGGGNIEGEIMFTNSLNERLNNVSIIVRLDGDIFDKKAVQTQGGFYDSNTNSIIWDQNYNDEFAFIEPGAEGQLNFSLPVLDLVNQEGVLINPSMIVSVDVSAVENSGNVLDARSVSRTEIRANSEIQALGRTTHYSGPFENTGPMPPKVNESTEYTLTFNAINSSNDLDSAKLVTYLPPYVSWLNGISPSSERSGVSFNTVTRELIWNMGKLESGVGIGNIPPRELSVQVSILPSISQLGSPADLTEDIVISGKDSFTDVTLNFTKRPLTTRLNNDSENEGEDGKISE